MADPVSPSAPSAITAAIEAVAPHAPTVPELLATAMRAHQEARVDDARLAYRALLQAAPDHPDGLHLLGMLEGQFGSGTEALALLRKAVALYPQEAMFHNNLGNALLQEGLQDEAEAAYARALEIDPKRYDALNNRALILSRRGDLKGAEAAFVALLALAPGFTEARQNLVHVCLRMGRVQDAMAHCVTGLVTAPHDRHLRGLLGRAYVQCKMPEKACEVYRQWISDDPDDPVPRHHLAALEGRPPERASDEYVCSTFDEFAGSFDQILGRLEYQAPALVGRAVQARLGPPAGGLRVLDAGCGTGLCGEHLAPYAQRLVGVDLSRRMLERAADRPHYHALHQDELVSFLRGKPASFDLVVSADTLCYFGALQAFAEATHAALVAGGWLVFTVEAHDDEPGAPDYRLHTHGRYSHRQGYAAGALRDGGFTEVIFEPVTLRHEMSQPVKGWLISARA
ncbi:tetratricopeptide repeat protein [Rubrivivax rivuli]|uniref:Tetratricopeptide repeat protein n=1 Tax=Rubrivivax rivuli TaxID=1862385 RepID=A0A437REK1_9BURK|nr:tetratricopeptide repeat protein [Rubrivivax rivuli]RVU45196.1 tetratricopeptide repeat protein [Rubrivivax rivuli]